MARPETEPKTNFARRLRQARKELGYDQMAFCRKLNIAKSTYAGWERGNNEPPISAILAFGKMNLSSKWLFTGDGDMFIAAREIAPLDSEALEMVLTHLENYLVGYSMAPEKKARLIRLLYEMAIDKQDMEAIGQVIDLFKVA